MQEEMRPQALKRIQTRLVLEKIAEVENIQPTDEEVEEEFKKMADAYKMEAVSYTHLYRVNALGARNLSIVARKCGSKIVQLSTDDVFDGQSKKPYTEFDDTNPLTVYGRSKRAGENYVKEFTHKHFVIRSNWVYGHGGHNFVNRVLAAAEAGNGLSVASDQFGSPTSAKAVSYTHLDSASEQ